MAQSSKAFRFRSLLSGSYYDPYAWFQRTCILTTEMKKTDWQTRIRCDAAYCIYVITAVSTLS